MTSDRFPGADLIAQGVADLHDGRRSIEAMLVARAAARLRSVGVAVPEKLPADPAGDLYTLLQARDGNGAHSSYNALTRRLLSFLRSAEQHARSR